MKLLTKICRQYGIAHLAVATLGLFAMMLNSYNFEQAKIGLTAQYFYRDCPVNPAVNFCSGSAR
ncbi:hypothetical protein [Fischerella sp. PCC 9605]|uniref:hypothetical protein n=1 Tax=Fischerella sp. PCC 9605 TaxID=1173024 RepID=UPI00047A2763|nr:hypothetical protein [Fischerella sp. PCC 9605]